MRKIFRDMQTYLAQDSYLPSSPNIDGKIMFKARHVIEDHRDHLKAFMVHASQIIQLADIRIMLAHAASLGFTLCFYRCHTSVFAVCHTPVTEILIKNPAYEFELEQSKRLLLFKPLHGLCDSVDLWHKI